MKYLYITISVSLKILFPWILFLKIYMMKYWNALLEKYKSKNRVIIKMEEEILNLK